MEKLRLLYKYQNIAINIAFTFWMVETIYFLILEGWHLEATSDAEIICDKIVGYMFMVWVILFFTTLNELLKKIIKNNA